MTEMQVLRYDWRADGDAHELHMVPVPGNHDIPDFRISTTPVTEAFWRHVTGANRSGEYHSRRPVVNISWDAIAGSGGFLDRLNASPIVRTVAGSFDALRFRLPSEAEWEYTARGGPHRADGFRFSGSNNIDDVAWYGGRFSAWRRAVCRVLGWERGWRLVSRPPGRGATYVHDVALKQPNQLGVYDMSGNVWEWCEDVCGEGERRLRGGCHHNWDIHCTVSFRYGFAQNVGGGAIGFRMVLA